MTTNERMMAALALGAAVAGDLLARGATGVDQRWRRETHANFLGHGEGADTYEHFCAGWRRAEAGTNHGLLQVEVPTTYSPQPGKVTHRVKSWPMFFDDIARGTRTSDIRLNDRRYRVGDELLLQRWDPVTSRYTGHELLVAVTYLQANKSNPCAISEQALHPDYCVLSVRKVGEVVITKAEE